MALSRIFDISTRSLAAYQNALSTTSHNISNANNPDYSRQRVSFSTVPTEQRIQNAFGSGVQIGDIQRIRSSITDKQLREYNQGHSFSEKQSSILSHVESLFSEPSELGLSNLINSFFDSWDKLAVNPSSVPLRNGVIESAQKMSSKIQNLHLGLSQVKTDVRSDAEEKINNVNSLLGQIREINQQVYEASVRNRNANDLLDKRDALISDLSKLANINVSFNDHNVATISIGGVFAVDRASNREFKLTEENGNLLMSTKDGAAHAALRGGEIYALTNSYSNLIPDYMEQLDSLSQGIMDKVNAVHQTGFTNESTPQTGLDFFELYDDGNLKINQDLLDNPNKIAISADGTSGNNQIALDIAALKNSDNSEGLTFSESYSKLVSDLASEKKMHEENASSRGLVINQLKNQQAEYSGVSLDEEMMNVLKFQRSYDASAKMIKVADEMLQTLLTMV
jgi:flagellar hook-associated protein 1 FlgK